MLSVKRGIVKCRELESRLDAKTAISVRRSYVAPSVLNHLPYQNYDYNYRSGGVSAHVIDEKMTRAPVVKFPNASDAFELKKWLNIAENFAVVKAEFESTSRGSSLAMHLLKQKFPSMQLLALSGNYCVDKKAAAINWIDGRGRSVVADCILPASVVASSKLQFGSARAVCIGGNNAHAANIVTAIFLATGQDPAQVISSSMCSTRMEETSEGDLYVSCTMPCVEVGTVGGGTILRPQNECLQMLSCAGPSLPTPGAHANRLAEIICSTVLAGELSLMAALVTDQLVSSHMKLNRSRLQLYPSTTSLSLPATQHPIENPSPLLGNSSKKDVRVKRTTLKIECSNIL
uniref:hydroxymethylglutaryl-CoA reductase (NADPH) n=1 Tax=Angiostrongylus cantonensis TaxID=6313 RepID=A0A158P829_ANGCA